MELRKITIEPDNEITHEIFLVKLPSAGHQDALVMKFTGVYGYGSGGNGDAEYMTAVTRAAVSFTDPFALIFDFSQLSYEWGDMMGQVLFSRQDGWENDEMPIAIVVSDLCEPAIESLLTDDLLIDDLSLVHHSLESALAYVDEKNRFGKSKAAD
jgi:hypothetical protein